MRELRSCDFCGGDAAGTFAIVPPELEPTDAEQRRVVLCPDCKDRLESLVEPLLARAGVDGGSDDESGPTGSTPDRESGSTPTETAPDDESASAGADASDEGDEGDESRLEDGITFDRSAGSAAENGANDESTTGTEPTDAAVDDTADAADASGESTADDPAGDAPGSDATTAAASDATTADDEPETESAAASRPPKAYGKVIRLLRNREFPMKRSAVEELAAGAYELEPGEADEIVDYAIEQGEFVEKRGKLKRP